MSKTKGGGSTRNGRDSRAQRLDQPRLEVSGEAQYPVEQQGGTVAQR